jgi:RimJ/RimL family protein N-acetyltransferase
MPLATVAVSAPVSLRACEPGDLHELESWCAEADTRRFLPGRRAFYRWWATAADRGDALEWVAEAGRLIGQVELLPDGGGNAFLLFVVAPHQRGRGLGHALLRAVQAQPEVDGFARIIALVDQDNAASRRCLEHAGFAPSTRFDPATLSYTWSRDANCHAAHVFAGLAA